MEHVIQFQKITNIAVTPTRSHQSDIGLDLFIISFDKMLTETTYLFDTGIIIKPPEGYYIEIVAHRSLSKTCWMISNSVGIINPNYRDSLKVALEYKGIYGINDVISNMVYPFRCCKIILRKSEYGEMIETDFYKNTDRDT